MAVACSLGIAHPPGYPLFTLLGKFFSLLPISLIAIRLNWMSAFFGSIASSLLFHAVTQWTRNEITGLLAAELFAFTPVVWSYSLVTEVFALNNLFLATLLYFVSSYFFYRESNSVGNSQRWLFASALLFGLAFAHHHTFLILGIPILSPLLLEEVKIGLNQKKFFTCLLLGAMGPLFYLYLPFTSLKHPTVAWGTISNGIQLWGHIFRQEYGTFQLTNLNESTSGFLENLQFYLQHIFTQNLYFGPLVALAGIVLSLRQNPERDLRTNLSFSWGIFAGFLIYLFTLLTLANIPPHDPLMRGVLERFWIAPSMIFCIWISIAITALLSWISLKKPYQWALASAFIALPFTLHFPTVDHSRNNVIDKYAKALFNQLPDRSILLVTNDLAYTSTRYLQTCEKFRPDVNVLNLNLMTRAWFKSWAQIHAPDIAIPGGYYLPGKLEGYRATSPDPLYAHENSYSMVDFLNANFKTHSIFVTSHMLPEDSTSVDQQFGFIPLGWWLQALPKSYTQPYDLKTAQKIAFQNLGQISSTELAQYPNDSWEHFVATEQQTLLERAKQLAK